MNGMAGRMATVDWGVYALPERYSSTRHTLDTIDGR
jgi:hypothetical protein